MTIFPVDLQAHSTRSDGTDTPTELVQQAAQLGIRVLSLTDHDSVLGVAEAQAAGQRYGVQIVPAIEFSTRSERAKGYLDINILGYGIEPSNPDLLAMLQRVIDSRVAQKVKQIERLQAYGLAISVDEVLALAGGVPGRPHIAQVLMQRNPGRFENMDQVFQEYLAGDAVNSTYVARAFSLRVEESIELTHLAGGVAVLAHPGIYHRVRDVDGLVRRLAQAGLDGLEIWYPYAPSRGNDASTPAEEAAICAHFHDLAGELKLLKTGGSDYHGTRKPAIGLGMAGLTWAQWEAVRPSLNFCGV